MYLIDTHAHLNDSQFQQDLPQVIARAEAEGVKRIIVCGYDMQSSRDAVDMAREWESVWATVGIHPHDAKNYNDQSAQELVELSAGNKVIAIGEIGLDFHYDFSPRPEQYAAFEAQIKLADTLGMPIVVHSRESNPEALQVLRDNASNVVGCVFHCFSGDEDFARQILDLGYYIGVDGPVTYKASEKLRRVIEMCPLDRLLVETDCPYLTPVPYRGKRNEPAYVKYVAEAVAAVKGITTEELAAITTDNAARLFGGKLTGGSYA